MLSDRELVDMAVDYITLITLDNWGMCTCATNARILHARVEGVIAEDIRHILESTEQEGMEERIMLTSLRHVKQISNRREAFSRGLHLVGAGAAFSEERRHRYGVNRDC